MVFFLAFLHKLVLKIKLINKLSNSILGLLCDLLWSDPDKNVKDWNPNDRGVSVTFSEEIIEEFLEKQDLDLICRAHQVIFFLNVKLLKNLFYFLKIL